MDKSQETSFRRISGKGYKERWKRKLANVFKTLYSGINKEPYQTILNVEKMEVSYFGGNAWTVNTHDFTRCLEDGGGFALDLDFTLLVIDEIIQAYPLPLIDQE